MDIMGVQDIIVMGSEILLMGSDHIIDIIITKSLLQGYYVFCFSKNIFIAQIDFFQFKASFILSSQQQ